jgi:hypothetical protein
MIDLIHAFFVAIKYSYSAIAHPSEDKTIRRLQWGSLIFCVSGNLVFVAAVVDFVFGKFANPLWLYLIITAAGLWVIGIVIGGTIDSMTGGEKHRGKF